MATAAQTSDIFDQVHAEAQQGQSGDIFDQVHAEQQQADPGYTMRAAPTGVGEWLNSLENDVRYGGTETLPGRVLHSLGAQGINRGVSEGVANSPAITGPVLGPINTARGITEIPQHPLSGAWNTLSGLLQTAGPATYIMAPEASTAAIGKAAAVVPSFERAGNLINEAEQVAGKVPLKVTDDLSKAASDLYQQKDYASQVPRVAQKLFQRLTDPDTPDLTFAEARKFYSNISRLSADEMNKMNPVTKRLMGSLRVSLDDALQQVANENGVGQQYRAGMQGYRSAAQWEDTKEAAGTAVKDLAKWGARAAVGRTVWGGLGTLYDLLDGNTK